MKELKYDLIREDYQDWIHWNVEKGSASSKKRRLFVFGILVVMMTLMFYVNRDSLTKDPKNLLSIGFMVAMVAVIGISGTSKKNQERNMWKRSGLEKMERQGRLPRVVLTLGDKAARFRITNLGLDHFISYRQMDQFEELERLLMVRVGKNTWQIIAKSAFESEEEKDQTASFLKEKIEDANARPEEYPETEEEAKAAFFAEMEALGLTGAAGADSAEGAAAEGEDGTSAGEAAGAAASAAAGSSSGAGPARKRVNRDVDTSNMGRLGKLAHFVNPETEDEEEEEAAEEPSAAVPKQTEAPVAEEATEAAEEPAETFSAEETTSEEAVVPAEEESGDPALRN